MEATVARSRGFFGPSERALEFGRQYAEVLACWGEFFAAAAALTAANVKLGEMTADASNEFDRWVKGTANAPWNWMNPEAMRNAMGGPAAPEPPSE
jgi:hypothetical protein